MSSASSSEDRPGAIELVGEPGVGKTPLFREIATGRPRLERFEPEAPQEV